MRYLFLGERPSPTALAKGWTWKDGRLAGKQLFDALAACDIEPADHRFDNLFVVSADVVCPKAVRRVKRHQKAGCVVVAMGKKVSANLERLRVPFRSIPHPAARGKVRKKEVYAGVVRRELVG